MPHDMTVVVAVRDGGGLHHHPAVDAAPLPWRRSHFNVLSQPCTCSCCGRRSILPRTQPRARQKQWKLRGLHWFRRLYWKGFCRLLSQQLTGCRCMTAARAAHLAAYFTRNSGRRCTACKWAGCKRCCCCDLQLACNRPPHVTHARHCNALLRRCRWGTSDDKYIFATFSGSISCFSSAPRTESDFSEAMGVSAAAPVKSSAASALAAAPVAPHPQPGIKLPVTNAASLPTAASKDADATATSAPPLNALPKKPSPPLHPPPLPLHLFPPLVKSWVSAAAAGAGKRLPLQLKRCGCSRRSARRASPPCM